MAKEYVTTRIKVEVLAQAKEIVNSSPEYSSVAHMLEVLIHKEAQKLKRSRKSE